MKRAQLGQAIEELLTLEGDCWLLGMLPRTDGWLRQICNGQGKSGVLP